MQDPSAPLTTHTDSTGEFVIYNTEDGRTEVQLRLIDGSVWMTQAEMSELFDISRSGVSEHLKSIFNTGELNRDEVVRKFRKEPGHAGYGRTLEHYNLDTIMAVGFRVRGPRGNQFREADRNLVEALQEADRKLISQRKRLQPRRKSD